MPVYRYRAKNLNGVIISGNLTAEDEKNAIKLIRSIGYYPFWISKGSKNNRIFINNKMSNKELTLFCRQMALYNATGISILRAFEIIKGNMSFKYRDYFDKVIESLKKGINISSSLSIDNVLPDILIKMICVGESSGRLDEVFESMAEYFEWKYKIEKKTKQALIYPVFVIVTTIAALNILLFKVLPSFIALFNAFNINDLPFETKMLLKFSNLIKYKGLIIILALLILIMIFKRIVKNENILLYFSSMKFKIPLYGKFYSNLLWLNFLRAFSILISSGVSIIESIDICIETIENSFIKKSLKNSLNRIKEGNSIASSFAYEKIVPITIIDLISTGEETGSLDIMIKRCFELYEIEVESMSAKLVSIIEPLLIFMLTFVVGFIILSFLKPIFQLYDLIIKY